MMETPKEARNPHVFKTNFFFVRFVGHEHGKSAPKEGESAEITSLKKIYEELRFSYGRNQNISFKPLKTVAMIVKCLCISLLD